MLSIDDFVDNPDWQPSTEEAVFHANIPERYGRENVTLSIRTLNNGLMYVVVKDSKNRNVLRNLSDNDNLLDDEVHDLPDNYSLVSLISRWIYDVPGFSATFVNNYDIESKGFPDASLEYTLWHNPNYRGKEVTIPTSLYAAQAVGEGWLDLKIQFPTYPIHEGFSVIQISSSGELDGELSFNEDGSLVIASSTISDALGQLKHPTLNVYNNVSRGAKIDAIASAVALIKHFPSTTNIDMASLVQYK